MSPEMDPTSRERGVGMQRLLARATVRAGINGFRWAAAGAAFLVGVDGVVLVLVVEAHVMHLLEDVEPAPRDLDRATAPPAIQRLG